MNKFKQHAPVITLAVSLAVFILQDWYGARVNNFEKMTEKFCTKESIQIMMTDITRRLERMENKLDGIYGPKTH